MTPERMAELDDIATCLKGNQDLEEMRDLGEDLAECLREIDRQRRALAAADRLRAEDLLMLEHERSRGDMLVRGGEKIVADRDYLRSTIKEAAKHLKHGPMHAGGRGACESPCIKCEAAKL